MKPYNLPGPKAKAIIDRDKQVISPSYPRAYEFVMDHGSGAEVWDVDGNHFVDFVAGIAVNSTGHSHPKVVQAIKDQAEKFIHISSDYYHPTWVKLGEKLNQISPFSEEAASFMTNSGAESVEAAIKLARHHTGRSQYVAFLGAFHGRTLGALSFTASKPVYHRGFYPLLNGVTHIPYPDAYRPLLATRSGETYGQAVVRYLKEEILERVLPYEEVAAVIVEPIQGEGGYVVPDEGFFPALRELCSQHGIMLIADEVQSGVGRTGKWWAIEHFGVEPDIVCSAKGIASGMPMGAMIAKKSVMTWPTGAHGNTYGGNPIASAAALATLDLIENEYMQNAAEVGEFALDAMEEIQSRHPSVGQVRGKGLMLGMEFVTDSNSKTPNKHLRDRVEDVAFHHGLLTMGCGRSALRIAPPLCITRDQMEDGLKTIDYAISQAEKEA